MNSIYPGVRAVVQDSLCSLQKKTYSLKTFFLSYWPVCMDTFCPSSPSMACLITAPLQSLWLSSQTSGPSLTSYCPHSHSLWPLLSPYGPTLASYGPHLLPMAPAFAIWPGLQKIFFVCHPNQMCLPKRVDFRQKQQCGNYT